MALDKLNIEEKVDNETKRKLLDSGLVAEDETLSAKEVNAMSSKINELVDAYNFGTPITGFNFKENVATYADLPTEGNEVNDGYGVLADGLIYVWNGENFQNEGNGIDLGLRAKGKVEEGVQEAVSGSEVYKTTMIVDKYISGINIYDKDKNIEGKYINVTTGQLQSNAASLYIVSGEMRVFGGDFIYISDWNISSSFCFRFIDENGNPLKPINDSGDEIGYGSKNYSKYIVAPQDAVAFQLTITFNNRGSQENLFISKSDSKKETINDKYIAVNGLVEKNNKLAVSGGEVFKSTMATSKYTEGINLYDFNNDIEGRYINTTTGALQNNSTSSVSEIINVTKIDFVVIRNRVGVSECRFLDINSNPLKALDEYGNVFPSYASGENGRRLFKPEGAVGFQFTTKLTGTTSREDITVRDSEVDTERIRPEFIDIVDYSKPLYFSKKGNNLTISGISSKGREVSTHLILRNEASEDSNPNFNITGDYIGGVLLKSSGDDIAPAYIDGLGYLGGNHGFPKARLLNFEEPHGKTYSDIGSVYKDQSNRDFVVLRIIDDNKLVICSKNIATDGYSFNYPIPLGTLIYQSNGSNTNDLNGFTQSSLSNLYNVTRLNYTRVFADSLEVISDTNHTKCSTFKIVEDYDMLDMDSVLESLINNRPLDGYPENINLNNFGEIKLFNCSIEYNWSNVGKCTIYHSFTALKKIKPSFHSFIQAQAISKSSLYIPKSLPNRGSDFRQAPAYLTPIEAINFTPEYWEIEDNAPDRLFNYVDGNRGIHFGYTRFGDGAVRENFLNRAIFLNTSRKMYPMGISDIGIMNPFETFSFICFRNIIDHEDHDFRRLVDFVKVADKLLIYADYKSSGIDSIVIPSDYSFSNIEIVEKTENVTLISNKIIGGNIKVLSEVSNNYGYIVIKLS